MQDRIENIQERQASPEPMRVELAQPTRIKLARPIVDGLWLGIGFMLAPVVVGIVFAVIVLAMMGY